MAKEVALLSGDAIEGWSQETINQLASMLFLLPKAESDHGEGIAIAILNASRVSDLDKPWQERDEDELLGRWLEIQSAAYEVSDKKGGIGYYLQVRAVDLEKVEPIVFSTSSVSVMAQIVTAHAMDNGLPLTARIVKAAKATKAGFFPKHLELKK